MKYISKIFLMIILTVVIGLIILTLYFIIQKDLGNTPYVFKYTSFYNTGRSMGDVIPEGNIILVKKYSSYSKGDIITYKNNENRIVTHRIYDIKNKRYITKGDSNNFVDGYKVKYSDIYGKVVYNFSIRWFLRNARYFILVLIIIPFVYQVLRRSKYVR